MCVDRKQSDLSQGQNGMPINERPCQQNHI